VKIFPLFFQDGAEAELFGIGHDLFQQFDIALGELGNFGGRR
jgi:hypothetical protein